jgi:hypothetical protein
LSPVSVGEDRIELRFWFGDFWVLISVVRVGYGLIDWCVRFWFLGSVAEVVRIDKLHVGLISAIEEGISFWPSIVYWASCACIVFEYVDTGIVKQNYVKILLMLLKLVITPFSWQPKYHIFSVMYMVASFLRSSLCLQISITRWV